MQNGVGIDLGSATLKIATAQDGILAKEPSLLAVDKSSARILDIGDSAVTLVESHKDAVLLRPFSKGLLSRKNMTRYVLSEIFSSLESRLPAAVAVPSEFSEAEGRELCSILLDIGFPSVSLVQAPTAALYGAGMSPDTDCILVDFGAARTNISLFLDGACNYTATLSLGGNDLDREVTDFLLTEYKLRVSPSAAELLKIRIGTAWNDGEEATVRISGESLANGAPSVITVTGSVLMNAFEKTLSRLVEEILGVLRRIPLSKVESLFKNGIFLVGGSSALTGLDRLIGALSGVHTASLSEGADAVVLGLARIASLSPSDPVDAAMLSRLIYLGA